MYEIAAPFLTVGTKVLDIGCRDARHLIELARRHSIVGVGVDPVAWHVERAQAATQAAGLGSQIIIRSGRAESLPDDIAGVDVIWRRDVIEVLPDLAAALAEMYRVLRPGGHVIVYTNILNGPIDPAETVAIHEPLGNVVGNLVEYELEALISAAGLLIDDKRIVGTEWREHLEEREQTVSRDLLRLSRLRRNPDRFIKQYGTERYRVAEASLQWGVQQFLGRFVSVIYTLSSPQP